MMETGPIVPCNNIEQRTTLCSDNENTNKSANSIPLESFFFGSKLRDLFNSHHGLAQRPSKVRKAMLHAHLDSLSLSLSS